MPQDLDAMSACLGLWKQQLIGYELTVRIIRLEEFDKIRHATNTSDTHAATAFRQHAAG